MFVGVGDIYCIIRSVQFIWGIKQSSTISKRYTSKVIMSSYNYCHQVATMATTMLLVLVLLTIESTVSAYIVPTTRRLIRPNYTTMMRRQHDNSNSHSRKIARVASTSKTKLSLALDPTDIVQHAHTLHDSVVISNYHQAAVDASSSSSTLDMLSSLTLAKASNIIVPNQSLAPLTETIKSITDTAATGDAASNNNNMVELIPDMPSMPGGVPRTGNAFLSGSFRELYQGTLPSTPLPTSENGGAYWSSMSPDGTLSVPARELDVIGRYSDLLNRIPLAAAVYALIDFFIINAEEDMAIAELMLNEDDENENEVLEAIMDVENKVVFHRFLGLFSVVTLTIIWSLISYHPVPLNELL